MDDTKNDSESPDLNEKSDNESGEQKKKKLSTSSVTSPGEEVIVDDGTAKSPSASGKENESLESVQKYASRIKSFLGWEPYLEEFEKIVSGLKEDTGEFPEFDEPSVKVVVKDSEDDREESAIASPEGNSIKTEDEANLESQVEDSCSTYGNQSMELNEIDSEILEKSESVPEESNLESSGDEMSELPNSSAITGDVEMKDDTSSKKDNDISGHSDVSFSNDLGNISVNGNDAVRETYENDSNFQEIDANFSEVNDNSEQEVSKKSDCQDVKEDSDVGDVAQHEDNSEKDVKELLDASGSEHLSISQAISSDIGLSEIATNPDSQVEEDSVINVGSDPIISSSDPKSSEIGASPEIDFNSTESIPQTNPEAKLEIIDIPGAKVIDQKESQEFQIIAEGIEVLSKPENKDLLASIEEENKNIRNNNEFQSKNVKDNSDYMSEKIVFKNCDKNPYMKQIRRLSLDIVKYVVESSVQEIIAKKNLVREDTSNGDLAKPFSEENIKSSDHGKGIKNTDDALETDKPLTPELNTDQYLYHTLNKSCEDIESKYKNYSVESLARKESVAYEDSECGIGSFKPRWIQQYARPKMYLTLFSIIGIINGCYYSYIVSIISTLEKRYAFKSKVSGLILLSDEIVPLLFGVLVGYIGTRTHRPRMLAIGMMMTAACSFISGIPYLIYGSAKHLTSFTYANKTGPEFCDSGMMNKECDADLSPPTLSVVIIFIVASFLKGFGTLSYYIIGISYMDDNIKKKNTPLYLAVSLAMRLLGPLVGFIMSSGFLKIYEDPFEDPGFGQDDPRWIGAWWIGFFLQGVLLVIFTLPIALFPRRLPGRKSMDKTTAPKSKDSWKQIFEGLLSALKRLGKNPVFVLLIIYTNAKIFGQFGHFIMLPKYMENQFRLSASEASLYSGATSIACIMIATVVGGFIIWKLRPGIKPLIGGIIVSDLLMCIGFLALMIPRCQPANMVNFGRNSDGLILENACNQMCDCSTTSFAPFCGPDGKTYFSPCFAGCSNESSTSYTLQKELHNCSCVAHAENQTLSSTISEGLCPDDSCWVNALIFLVILLIILSISNSFTVVHTMVLLRTVHPNDKSIALGTFEALVCLFGFIPFPITIGALVDSACLVWEQSCGETGNCWFYDMDKFAYLLHGVSAGFCFLAVLCMGAMYFQTHRIRDLYADDDDEKTHVANIKLDTVSESVTKL